MLQIEAVQGFCGNQPIVSQREEAIHELVPPLPGGIGYVVRKGFKLAPVVMQARRTS